MIMSAQPLKFCLREVNEVESKVRSAEMLNMRTAKARAAKNPI